ncbi:PopZ family protein [Aquamicrobium zhengzhouense]|uniref:DUF2497 domain-containing protein n=1 Tax=Aquamicrobium zhengzhouense TaxID=2781738 RepID=A0ABS0SAY1_9HYPH|nr:PopZ family protein [Aquamicrobium zhengzhouense]MBI1620449.1 DUF2497 domain-containing protein [Aquamicrobium zhengzhouense]
MAQTGSAQREPSMEEILASIRRIIEDSDSVRQPLEEATAELRVISQPMADADVRAASADIEAFREEFEEHADDPASAVETIQPTTQAMVDQPIPEAEEVASVANVSASQEDVQQVTAPADGFVQVARDDSKVADVEATTVETAPQTVAEGEMDEKIEARPALISGATERQVAAAFGELSEAFAASRRRSFDEMAEEMLRPMLQDWLDNNLPTLVEKLVREEIERVARGGQ